MLSDKQLDLLAWDVSDAFAKDGHPLDLSLDDIRPHLAEFIAKCQATAAGRPAEEDAEPGPDAARMQPAPAVAPEPVRYEPPRMGRVRAFTQYTFQVWGSGADSVPEASVVDWHKRGESWAREHALTAAHRQYPDAIDPWLGFARKDQIRIRPYAGQSVEIPEDADEVIFS